MNRRTELRKRDRATRRLFVVDIENAIGSGRVDEESCVRVERKIESVYRPNPSDLTVIGVSHKNNLFPAHAWSGARVVLKEGHDGADLALESVLAHENVEGRVGKVVIVSGDHLFAGQAARLRSLGLDVIVDAPARKLARVLAFSCSCVRLSPSLLAA